MKWIPYGPDGWLLQFAEEAGDEAFRKGRALEAELARRPPPGLREYVPSITTILLEFEPGSCPPAERRALEKRLEKVAQAKPLLATPKEIPVVYDGPDLERVAHSNKLTVADVVRRHAATVYKVYALGFAPGFPYLGDLDRRLHTPRLSSPRSRVPAGSVAIGGAHTGIYSIETPGGWNLIGRAGIDLFTPAAAQSGDPRKVFFLQPGDRVRFIVMGRGGSQ